MFLFLCASTLICILLAALYRYSNRLMFLVGSAFCAGFFVFLLIFAYIVFDRETATMRGTQTGEALSGIREEILWVPDLNLNFAFSFDALSLFLHLL